MVLKASEVVFEGLDCQLGHLCLRIIQWGKCNILVIFLLRGMYAYVKKNREERRAEMNQFLHDHTSHSLEAVTVIISVSKSCPGCCYNLKDILVLPGPSS